MTLDQATVGQKLLVADIRPPAGQPEWLAWLTDLGFTPGEQVELLQGGSHPKDPIVFRVGQCKIALRRSEAACITVQPEVCAE